MDATDRRSILSHGEREVAAMLREGQSVEEIANRRDDPIPVVEKARDRIRAKTERALATLVESPCTADAARDLDEEARARLRSTLADPPDRPRS